MKNEIHPNVKKRIEAIAWNMAANGVPVQAFNLDYLSNDEREVFRAAWKRAHAA